MRRFTSFAIIFFLFILFTYEKTKAAAATEQTVEVALASNFNEVSSNTLNPFLNSFEKGVQLAVAEHRSKLAANHIAVRLRKYNIGGDASSIRQSAKAIAESAALATIGYHSSLSALLAGPVLEKAQVLTISPSASANRVFSLGPHFFSMAYSNESQAVELAKLASRRFQTDRVHVISIADCTYCNDLGGSFERAAQAEGLKTYRHIILDNLDGLPAISQAILAHPESLVFIPGYELTSARIISHLLEAGFHGTFLGGDGWYNANGVHMFNLIKYFNRRGYFIGHWDKQLPFERNKRFVANYLRRYGDVPNTDAALGYDSMQFLMHILLQSDRLTRDGLIRSLRSIKQFESVTGTMRFSFRPNRDSAIRNWVVTKNAPLFSLNFTRRGFDLVATQNFTTTYAPPQR